MRANITGIGWVTAAGMGRGRTQGDFTMPSGRPFGFDPQHAFSKPCPNLRRMDHFSRMGVTAIALALTDAGLVDWTEKRPIGVVASTVFGCLGADVEYYTTVIPNRGAQASPTLFSYTSANSFLGEASILFGLTGTNYAISDADSSGMAALQAALENISLGEDLKILGGVCDAGCPEIFKQPDTVPQGAVFFMLESVRTGSQTPFGRLSSDASGTLRFNDSKVAGVTDLAKQCLSEISE